MEQYAFKYARVKPENGMCVEVRDTVNFINDPEFVPIPADHIDYIFKYYWPLPDVVESFEAFTGQWYIDEDYADPFVAAQRE